nr:MAG TPA: hypothetical protein [Caudoviricetes sp.]
MAVRTRDEIMEAIKARLGDDTSDEALEIIEDINDTFSDYETRSTDDWKTKYDELDANWRKRYRDRFFQTPGNKETDNETVVDDNEEDLKDEGEEKSFESLFEEKEDNSGY